MKEIRTYLFLKISLSCKLRPKQKMFIFRFKTIGFSSLRYLQREKKGERGKENEKERELEKKEREKERERKEKRERRRERRERKRERMRE